MWAELLLEDGGEGDTRQQVSGVKVQQVSGVKGSEVLARWPVRNTDRNIWNHMSALHPSGSAPLNVLTVLRAEPPRDGSGQTYRRQHPEEPPEEGWARAPHTAALFRRCAAACLQKATVVQVRPQTVILLIRARTPHHGTSYFVGLAAD